MSTQNRSSTLSHLSRERPETRRMSQEQISRDAMSGKPVCVSRSRDGTMGGMEQPQYQRSGSAYPVQPTENHVRMSRHRMVENVVASLAAATPRIVQALAGLLAVVAWHWLQR